MDSEVTETANVSKVYSTVKFDFDMERHRAKLNFSPNILLIV